MEERKQAALYVELEWLGFVSVRMRVVAACATPYIRQAGLAVSYNGETKTTLLLN